MHQGNAVAAGGLVHEVGRDEDRHAIIAGEVDHQLPERVSRDGVDSRRRLVEDQHLRFVDHGHGQRQALANAQRQRPGQIVEYRPEAEALHHFLHPRVGFGERHVEQPRVQQQVLPHGEFPIEREGLRHVADPAADSDVAAGHRFSEQKRLALGGRKQAGEHLHGGRLAAPVRSQKAEDLAPLDGERHMIDGREAAEAARQAARLDSDLRIRPARRDRQLPVPAALRFGQHLDEGRFERRASASRLHLAGRAGRQHAARVHRHQPIEALRFLHVGGGHDHAHAGAPLANAIDQIPELAPRKRIDAGRRFVENQQIRIVNQRAAEAQLLLHAAR
jgi:hypothetical protein